MSRRLPGYHGLRIPRDVAKYIMKMVHAEIRYIAKKYYWGIGYNAYREITRLIRTDISRWQVLRSYDPRFEHLVLYKHSRP